MLKPYYKKGNDSPQPLELFEKTSYQDGIYQKKNTSYHWSNDDEHIKMITNGWVSSMVYDSYDYSFAYSYLKKHYWNVGGCSAIQVGKLRGRNYDWNYDNQPTVIIRTPAKNGRHATIGFAAGQGELDKNFINTKMYSEMYKILPFRIVDGINDAGLIANTNVCQIYNDAGELDITNVTDKQDPAIPALMFTRYVLDYCSTVDEVINVVNTRNLFMANSSKLVDEFHFMITDKSGRTVIIEYKNNQPVIIEDNIMTNYKLSGDTGHDYGAGYERTTLLRAAENQITNAETMLAAMKQVWYTNAYKSFITKENEWWSECNGKTELPSGEIADLHQGCEHEDYAELVEIMKKLFNNRSRDTALTWQTVHTTIYDPDNNRIILVPQENENFKIELKMM